MDPGPAVDGIPLNAPDYNDPFDAPRPKLRARVDETGIPQRDRQLVLDVRQREARLTPDLPTLSGPWTRPAPTALPR